MSFCTGKLIAWGDGGNGAASRKEGHNVVPVTFHGNKTQGQYSMEVNDLIPPARLCAEILSQRQFRRIAVVRAETSAWDQAFLSPAGEQVLVRCAIEANEADRKALETIASQGPFDRIFYVFDEGACSPGQGFTAVSTADFAARATALVG